MIHIYIKRGLSKDTTRKLY